MEFPMLSCERGQNPHRALSGLFGFERLKVIEGFGLKGELA